MSQPIACLVCAAASGKYASWDRAIAGSGRLCRLHCTGAEAQGIEESGAVMRIAGV